MEKSSFFNSVSGDRKYDATDWAEYFASFIGNGVFGSPADCLQIVPDGGMRMAVLPGSAWINGYFYVNTERLSLQLSTADGVLKRIDRIVLRWSMADRCIVALVKQGVSAANPMPPVLQRDASVFELAIADILVDNGATSIVESKITDRRGDIALCGIVTSIVSEAHTHNLNDLQGPLTIAKGGTGATDANAARASLGAAALSHTHPAAQISDVVPISKGGTGAVDAASARNNLGATLTGLGAAAASHTHTSAQLTDAVPVNKGGTGADDATAARANLGVTLANLGAAAASHTHASSQLTDAVPIAKGGTGATTAAAARNSLGLGNTSGALPIANGGTGAVDVASARSSLGLGNTAGALPVENGGTGQSTVAGARNALGLGNTSGFLPIANGGTGADGPKAALQALGIFYSASLPATGIDGQICLIPLT